MKIDILSMQRVYNYGSFLQAYGLMKLIENLGHSVSFIDIEQGDHEGIRIEKGTVLADHKRTYDRYSFRRFKYKTRANKRDRMFEEQRRKHLRLTDEQCTSKPCDIAVIGSDEVFNCNKANPYGISLQLFGNISCASKVISYAASCGYTSYNDVPVEYRNPICEALNNLSYVSVRDQNTYDFVNRVCGKKPMYHLDPVLIYPFTKELELVEQKLNITYDYMIVYAYKNRFKNSDEIKKIKEFARKRKLKIISLGDSQYWADDYLIPSPFELLAYFKYAKYVLTDTFHGTILAAKYHKRMAVVVRPSNENKLIDLLNRIGITSQRVDDFENLEKVMESQWDCESFEKIIVRNRQLTNGYLREAGL